MYFLNHSLSENDGHHWLFLGKKKCSHRTVATPLNTNIENHIPKLLAEREWWCWRSLRRTSCWSWYTQLLHWSKMKMIKPFINVSFVGNDNGGRKDRIYIYNFAKKQVLRIFFLLFKSSLKPLTKMRLFVEGSWFSSTASVYRGNGR